MANVNTDGRGPRELNVCQLFEAIMLFVYSICDIEQHLI